MSYINLIDHEGTTHKLDAVSGWRVMEIIREHGFPIEGTCGGAIECGTCAVDVNAAWIAKLPEASTEEQDMLDDVVENLTEGSRLSCQIIYDDSLEGLTISLIENE